MEVKDQEKLLDIIRRKYEIAGATEAPEHVLDVLADPLAATQEQIDKIEALPVVVNINSEFSAVLTQAGADTWNAWHWQFPADERPAKVNAGDTISDTLWHLMAVFGPHMSHAGENMFENCLITLKELR